MEKKVTMKQLAKELGISINAVSLALNDREGVSEKTRKQVLKLANETGYLEQSNKYNKTYSSKNICVLIRKIYFQDMHFYSRVIYGIEWQADKLGYDIIMQFADDKVNVPSCVENHKVAGIIIVGPVEKDRIEALNAYGIPMVIVDSTTYGFAADNILSDNRSGAFSAANLLVKNGYQKIGFFGDLDYSLSIKERYLGYVEAMTGVMEDGSMQTALLDTMKYSLLKNIEEHVLNKNVEAITELIKSMEEIPEVFLCSNDRAAILLMNALRSLEYRVPEDIGIVGFDDMEISTMVMPGLTTLHIAKKNMGMKAVQTLQWRLQNRKAKPEKIVLPVELVIRGSVQLGCQMQDVPETGII
ncbi:MAG: LacI family transcriptional regulator [Lachnospiraceae bacterium]|nr:LacI family transcriptional regulator [Lachnospiraceae bacterium]